jgi:hypothetical protein
VFSFTAGITLATGVLFGVAPAWSATRAEVGTAIKDGAKASTKQRKGWSGRTIVSFQIALSTLLVVGASLFLRTLINLNAIDVGFRADGLVLFDLNPPSKQYPAPKDIALHARIEQALCAVPGVEGITLTDIPLLADSQSQSSFNVEGAPETKEPQRDGPGAMQATVGQDFLSVMGIPMVAGRGFTPQDADAPQRFSIVNQALARKYFPNRIRLAVVSAWPTPKQKTGDGSRLLAYPPTRAIQICSRSRRRSISISTGNRRRSAASHTSCEPG